MTPGSIAPIAVIGAGAAGFMAALFAARRLGAGRPTGAAPRGSVLLLERTPEGGKKILMSGGGRCNVLPSAIDPARFVTGSSPHSLKKLLLSWPLREQRDFFEREMGLALELEEETGKLFPRSNSARDVRDGLRALAERAGVEFRGQRSVVALEREAARWRLRIEGGSDLLASRVVIATGGLSVPATGSDGTGIRIVRALGHTIHDPYPALTPITASPHRYAALSGVSLPVTLHAPGPRRSQRVRGGFLFTHKGYSGPAVLNLSHLAVLSRRAGGPPQAFHVQWTDLDADGWDRLLRGADGAVGTLMRRHVPARLAEALLEDAAVDPATPLAQLTRDHRRRVIGAMAAHPLPWSGDEGYTKAEVTGGGVALEEVDPRTLESRLAPGLHLCGEILDAFGPIGGHNFAWAWATGRLAGTAAAEAQAKRGGA